MLRNGNNIPTWANTVGFRAVVGFRVSGFWLRALQSLARGCLMTVGLQIVPRPLGGSRK